MTELSFIRISMADRTIAASFSDAEFALMQFTTSLGRRYRFIEHLPPAALLRGKAVRTYKEVSDHYLCELAAVEGARLATLDSGIKHSAAWLIT